MQRTCLTSQLYMEVYGVCKTIYSTSGDEELSSINDMRDPREARAIEKKNTHTTGNWAHVKTWAHLE